MTPASRDPESLLPLRPVEALVLMMLTSGDRHGYAIRQEIIEQTSVMDFKGGMQKAYVENDMVTLAADPIVQYMTKPDLKKSIENTRKEMLAAAKNMDFLLAAKLRDEMFALEKMMEEKF